MRLFAIYMSCPSCILAVPAFEHGRLAVTRDRFAKASHTTRARAVPRAHPRTLTLAQDAVSSRTRNLSQQRKGKWTTGSGRPLNTKAEGWEYNAENVNQQAETWAP